MILNVKYQGLVRSLTVAVRQALHIESFLWLFKKLVTECDAMHRLRNLGTFLVYRRASYQYRNS